MQPFTRLTAIAAALPVENVDTDKILAGRFLKTITRRGLGEKLFWSMRQDPSCVFNLAPWDKAGILIALDNFGCGSSREHAPWALLDFGIRCIIAPSIADIFYNNCFKNGILPIVLPREDVLRLLDFASSPTTAQMTVDLEAQSITTDDTSRLNFTVDPARRHDLLNGVDEIGRTLSYAAEIANFEGRADRRWIPPLTL